MDDSWKTREPEGRVLQQGEAVAAWVGGLKVQLEHLEAMFVSGTAADAAGLDSSDGALEEHTLALREETLKSLAYLRKSVREVHVHLENKVDNVWQILGR